MSKMANSLGVRCLLNFIVNNILCDAMYKNNGITKQLSYFRHSKVFHIDNVMKLPKYERKRGCQFNKIQTVIEKKGEVVMFFSNLKIIMAVKNAYL